MYISKQLPGVHAETSKWPYQIPQVLRFPPQFDCQQKVMPSHSAHIPSTVSSSSVVQYHNQSHTINHNFKRNT